MILDLKHINIDQKAEPQLQSRLTRVIEDKQKKDLVQVDGDEEVKLTESELQNVTEFFTNDIKNKPAADVHQLFRRMFKDMKVDKLRKYIFQSVS